MKSCFSFFRSICTIKKAKWTSVIFTLLPIVVHIPELFRFTAKVFLLPCGIGYVVSMAETNFGRNRYANIFVNLILNLVLQIIIPYGLVLIANVVLIVMLIKAKKRRNKLIGKVSNDT